MKIGIIGGSGLEKSDILQKLENLEVETPYGKVKLKKGILNNSEVYIISRHGENHELAPSNVNNRANIYALAKLGCKNVIATTATGSLKQEIERGDIVIPDQLIDFTKTRKNTFHDDFSKGIVHSSLADPFSEFLREKLIDSTQDLGFKFHPLATLITIEGPRFSTRAESNLFRLWQADIVNMSIAPEAALAREAELNYACLALSTDYDCWKEDELAVTWEEISRIMQENSSKAKQIIIKTIEKIENEETSNRDMTIIKSSIRTIPHWPKQGVMFRDITTLMKDTEAMKKAIEILVLRYKDKEIDVVAGIESRGFIFGAILAEKLNCEFVPIRKPGKLPAEVEREEYELEYGKDAVEIHKDAITKGDIVLVVDDLLATGGTALASCNLIKKLGGYIEECAFVIELPELRGKEKLESNNFKVFSIVKFEGE